MKLIIMQFSPRYIFIAFRSKYPPQPKLPVFDLGPRALDHATIVMLFTLKD
jgi:hypothetical protein